LTTFAHPPTRALSPNTAAVQLNGQLKWENGKSATWDVALGRYRSGNLRATFPAPFAGHEPVIITPSRASEMLQEDEITAELLTYVPADLLAAVRGLAEVTGEAVADIVTKALRAHVDAEAIRMKDSGAFAQRSRRSHPERTRRGIAAARARKEEG
jgi:hypothetical protein